jgi:hypothetical protein
MSRLVQISLIVCLLAGASVLRAQEDEVSLGDLAREARKSKAESSPNSSEPRVIDNDNFATVMDQAESARLNGKPVFSIDPSGKTFRMVSPDGSCSLSFDARAAALISSPYVASDLPQDELAKLNGPAAIRDGMLQVALHNGTTWELKEIVVGITLLQPQAPSEYHDAKLESALEPTNPEKPADMTVLYHLRATGVPDSTTIFRADLGGALGDTKDWHWAIVSARGVPPPASTTTVQAQPPATSATSNSGTSSSAPAIQQGQEPHAPLNPGSSVPN